MTPTKLKQYISKLPSEVQKCLGDAEYLFDQKFWQELKYDWANIGTVESKAFTSEYTYKSLIDLYKNTLQFSAALAESKTLYLSQFFDEALSINTGIMSVEGLSPEAAREVKPGCNRRFENE